MSGVKSVSCPYNPAHIMPEISLAGHLSKCTFRTPNFDSCRYNVMHIMLKVEIPDHQKTCPDKKKKKEEEDDDWGFTEEIRENMKKEIEMERKKRKELKKKEKCLIPEEKEPEKAEDDFEEPDFANIDTKYTKSDPLNLTQMSDMSMNQSTTSKKTKKRNIQEF